MRRYAAIFGIVTGLGMIGMWAMFFAAGDVPELRSAPLELGFHLAAEALAALSLLVAGIGLASRARWAATLYAFGLGAFAYTAVVSPGYFAQRGEWPFVVMFAALLVAAIPAAVGAVHPHPAEMTRS